MEIKVRYISGDEYPEEWKLKQTDLGDWIDLRANAMFEARKGEDVFIPLGVAMELPEGYEAHVVPRSSTFKNVGITMANSIGVIDSSYCGNNDEWFFYGIVLRDTLIEPGMRICQFRIVEKQPKITFKEVDDLGNPDRRGFGSTGVV